MNPCSQRRRGQLIREGSGIRGPWWHRSPGMRRSWKRGPNTNSIQGSDRPPGPQSHPGQPGDSHSCTQAGVLGCSVMANSLWHMAWARQAPLSMGLSRQEHWRGLPCPSPGGLPNPGIKPKSPSSQADSLPSEPRGSLNKNDNQGSWYIWGRQTRKERTQNKIKWLKGAQIRNQIKPQPKKPIITQEQD